MLTTRQKPRFPLEIAAPIAAKLVTLLEPACHRIVVAGSVRRQKPSVGDIELLAIPKKTQDKDLFGDPMGERHSQLDAMVGELRVAGILTLRSNVRGQRTYGPLNKLLVHAASGIPVDLFTATEENWGMALVVRTGPAEFNIHLFAELRRKGMLGHAYGGISGNGHEHPCPTEQDVFKLLRWPYREPWQR